MATSRSRLTHLACLRRQLPARFNDAERTGPPSDKLGFAAEPNPTPSPSACFVFPDFLGEDAVRGQTGWGNSARGVISPFDGAELVTDDVGEEELKGRYSRRMSAD